MQIGWSRCLRNYSKLTNSAPIAEWLEPVAEAGDEKHDQKKTTPPKVKYVVGPLARIETPGSPIPLEIQTAQSKLSLRGGGEEPRF